jgi:hypothetical protein
MFRSYIHGIKLNDMNPIYKLIKEYPGSEPLGTIFSPPQGGYTTYSVGKYHMRSTKWRHEYFNPWIGVYFEIIGMA